MAQNTEKQNYTGGGVVFYGVTELYAYLKNYHSTHSSYLSEINKSMVDLYIMYYSFDINIKDMAEITGLNRKTVVRRLNNALLMSKNKNWFVTEVDKTLDYILYNAKIIYSASRR